MNSFLRLEKRKFKNLSLNFSERFINFLKWIIVGLSIGVVVGLVGGAFHLSLSFVTDFRITHWWIILFLPVAGLLIILFYKSLGMYNDKGTNLVLLAVRNNESMSIKTALLIFVSTILTHLCGGSAGREGAALQIGGSVGSALGKVIKLDPKDMRIITMCGMSAGFASLFGTPVASTIFALEVTSVGIMYYSAIVPCMISAIVGSQVAQFLGADSEGYVIKSIPLISPELMLKVLLLAILCAIISEVFCIALKGGHHLFQRISEKNKFLRIVIGGTAIVIFSMIIRSGDYNGAGLNIITDAFKTQAGFFEFIIKIIFTSITLGCGFKGGEIVPAFFVGATFGSAMSGILNLPVSFGAGIGLVAVFCGVTNCPLASLVLAVELFGTESIVPFALACAVSYMLSGYIGLYNEQKIVYSKVKPEMVDVKIGKAAKDIQSKKPKMFKTESIDKLKKFSLRKKDKRDNDDKNE